MSRAKAIRVIRRHGVERFLMIDDDVAIPEGSAKSNVVPDLSPLHTKECFFPSAMTACEVRSSIELAPPTQESEDTDDDEDDESPRQIERLRLLIFADPWLPSLWFFLDCFAQGREQTGRVGDLLSWLYQRTRNENNWGPPMLLDCVQLFWETRYFLNARLKELYKLLAPNENKKDRDAVKFIISGIITHTLPTMILEFVEHYGLSSPAAEGLRTIRRLGLDGGSAYQAAGNFSCLAMALRPRQQNKCCPGW